MGKRFRFGRKKIPPKPDRMPKFEWNYGNPLYHGSSRDIQGSILPNSVHKQGRANSETKGARGPNDTFRTPERLAYDEWLRQHKAYATMDEDYAWHTFAHQTANRGGGRGRVYEVEPQIDMETGAFGNEYVANRFPIKRRLDIKPGHQGTFPIDWRPFLREDLQTSDWVDQDQLANHPSPVDQYREHIRRTRAEEAERLVADSGEHQEVPGQQALWGEHVPPLSHQFRGGLVPGGGV